MKAIFATCTVACALILVGCFPSHLQIQSEGGMTKELPDLEALPKGKSSLRSHILDSMLTPKAETSSPTTCEKTTYFLQCTKTKEHAGLPSFNINEHEKFLGSAATLENQLIFIELRVRGAGCVSDGVQELLNECGSHRVGDTFDDTGWLTASLDPSKHDVDEVSVVVSGFEGDCGTYKQCFTGNAFKGHPTLSVVARFNMVKTASRSGKRVLFLVFDVQRTPQP